MTCQQSAIHYIDDDMVKKGVQIEKSNENVVENKPKKSVVFVENRNEVHEVENFVEQSGQYIWYTKEELETMIRKNQAVANKINSDASIRESKFHTSRGLDSLITKRKLTMKKRQKKAWAVVLTEQSRQKEMNVDNPKLIAFLYRGKGLSSKSQADAIAVAEQDHLEVIIGQGGSSISTSTTASSSNSSPATKKKPSVKAKPTRQLSAPNTSSRRPGLTKKPLSLKGIRSAMGNSLKKLSTVDNNSGHARKKKSNRPAFTKKETSLKKFNFINWNKEQDNTGIEI